jgi:LmbE family N-acetylglucosaminyl deacetylase
MAILTSLDVTEPVPGQRKLNVLVFGAHPDDCDLRFGGIGMLYRAQGHRVRFVSMTNGDAGHYDQGGVALARRRFQEAQAAGAVGDLEYQVLDIHDGELEPTLEVRYAVIRIMREFRADLVVCHRPSDYHPDHRAVGIAVQDAAYTVTVPNVQPLTPELERAPVVGYLYDDFTIPVPYQATVAVSTDEVWERKVDMAHCHASQWYEWLPYNGGNSGEVPEGEAARREWLAQGMRRRFGAAGQDVREALVRCYGPERGRAIETAESVMISEYGRQVTDEEIPVLFPFFC